MKSFINHRKYKLLIILILGIGAAGTAVVVAKDHSAVKKSDSEPDYVILEESYWTPLIYEPYDSFTRFGRFYSQDEMQAAATEIDKARSWLLLCSDKAEPMTKQKLTDSAKTLKKLSSDLKEGKPIEAADLRFAIASAKSALAEWHYFKSMDYLAKKDETYASDHLKAAARYIRNAAEDINLTYPESVTVWLDSIDGVNSYDVNVVDEPHEIAANLQKLKNQLTAMSKALVKWQES